jgi:hypothetical protein
MEGRLAFNLGRELTIDERNKTNVTGVKQLEKALVQMRKPNIPLSTRMADFQVAPDTMRVSSIRDLRTERIGILVKWVPRSSKSKRLSR